MDEYPVIAIKTSEDATKWPLHAVHVLVAKAFLGDRSGEGLVVNHKNHDKSDPDVDNLEWTTRSDNGRAAHDAGRFDGTKCARQRVEVDGQEYESILAAAKALGVKESAIRRRLASGKAMRISPEPGPSTPPL